jgi:hypothetical protein
MSSYSQTPLFYPSVYKPTTAGTESAAVTLTNIGPGTNLIIYYAITITNAIVGSTPNVFGTFSLTYLPVANLILTPMPGLTTFPST